MDKRTERKRAFYLHFTSFYTRIGLTYNVSEIKYRINLNPPNLYWTNFEKRDQVDVMLVVYLMVLENRSSGYPHVTAKVLNQICFDDVVLIEKHSG